MKTEFEGTPGPWRADKRDWEESKIPWAIAVPYNGACLPIADVCYNPTNKEVIAANAHLIAAAPDLLEALQNMLDYPEEDLKAWSEQENTANNWVTISVSPLHIKAALIAIKKALNLA